MSQAFDFGKNWAEFSRYALTPEKVSQARSDFAALMQGVELRGRSFLDLGFGQGLSLLIAAAQGAKVAGCDINPTCREVLEQNRRFFPELDKTPIPTIIGSVLDEEVIAALRLASPDPQGTYDIVHSWGVLHHTGDMARALTMAADLVAPGGYLVLALYNRHWSSPLWLSLKWIYNRSSDRTQRLLVALFYPIIYLAKLVVTGENPRKQKRGMDFYYNVIDWVGGYPYEYATRDEITSRLQPLGFEFRRFVQAQVPTGCNEFVFQRTAV